MISTQVNGFGSYRRFGLLVLKVCSRSECRESGLRPQHPVCGLKVGSGPRETSVPSMYLAVASTSYCAPVSQASMGK